MATIKEYLDYAELAQVAYGFLSTGKPSINELENDKRADFSRSHRPRWECIFTKSCI